ncbi:glycosyltransferase [Microbacterium sp. Mu-80]|uniref:Glycosyltransferase n=1 Tax=Microbacterium bandirmense TaxID=3122050 RepID=A0ABU8LDV3_9MICO
MTVGLPVANEPLDYVRDAVLSVLNQSFQDWELIVVVDGAPRATVEFLRSFEDARVRVIAHPDSRGLAARLNEISGLARGEFLARMDADDIMVSSRLAHQLRVLAETKADVVTGRAVIVDEETRIVTESPHVSARVDAESMLQKTPFIHPTVIARTEWFRTHPYDETLLRCQDKALWITAASDSEYFRDPEPILFYRVMNDLNPRKYARSARYERKIIRRYGPPRIGCIRTASIVAQSLLKQLVVRVASALGQGAIVMRRRYDGSTTDAARWSEELRSSITPIDGDDARTIELDNEASEEKR